jgi:DNA-binding NarL/FixJ family response regulator
MSRPHGHVDRVVHSDSEHVRPRVIVVSDVLLYRHGLAASLERDGRIEVAAAISARDTHVALAAQPTDALLLDASTESGLALARQIRSSYPALRLVGFGISGGAAGLIACAESGLCAFVDRDGTVNALVSAVLSAIKGELNCSPRVAALICDRLASLAGGKAEASEPLTQRESEVAALVAEGLSNKEIAIGLRIGPATVKNHVHNILDKLKVPRRAAIPARLREAARGRSGAGPREPDLAVAQQGWLESS